MYSNIKWQSSAVQNCNYFCTYVIVGSYYLFYTSMVMFSCVWLFVTICTVAHQVLYPWDVPDKNTGVDWHFFFVSMSLLFWLFCLLDSLYKWGHVVFVFVLHLSLCITLYRSIRDIESGMISFLYWLSKILLKIYIYIYICIYICVSHLLCIYTYTHIYICTYIYTTSYLWTQATWLFWLLQVCCNESIINVNSI